LKIQGDELADSSNPSRSRVFTSTYMGAMESGALREPFRGLTDDSGRPVTRFPRRSSAGFSWVPQNQVLAQALRQFTRFGDMSATIEMSPHNQYHGYIGGHMGNPAISPADPIFYLHHAYTDKLWAAWQASRPQNRENLESTGSQATIRPGDRVVMYQDRWTVRDMLLYRERLCYEYDAGASRGLHRRAFSSDDDLPPLPDIRNVTSFDKIQPMPESLAKMLMPNTPYEHWQKVEAALNNIAADFNKSLADGTLDSQKLTTLDDLMKSVGTIVDDGKDSAIPEVINSAPKETPKASWASSNFISIYCSLIPLLSVLALNYIL
jgi:hypothetical protein